MPSPDAEFPASAHDVREGIAASAEQPFYKHFKGGWFIVLHFAPNAISRQSEVVYLSMHFGTLHACAPSEFFGHVTCEGYSGRRFTPHPEPIPATHNPAWREKYPHLC